MTAERSSLVGSTTGEIKNVEGQHDGVRAAVAAQRDIAVMGRWQRELWGDVANLTWHQMSPGIAHVGTARIDGIIPQSNRA